MLKICVLNFLPSLLPKCKWYWPTCDSVYCVTDGQIAWSRSGVTTAPYFLNVFWPLLLTCSWQRFGRVLKITRSGLAITPYILRSLRDPNKQASTPLNGDSSSTSWKVGFTLILCNTEWNCPNERDVSLKKGRSGWTHSDRRVLITYCVRYSRVDFIINAVKVCCRLIATCCVIGGWCWSRRARCGLGVYIYWLG